MRKTMLLLAIWGFSCTLWAQSPFDGTWKIELNKVQFPDQPNVLVLQNGNFQCPTCDPKINVKADGTDQSVQGSKAFNTVSVKILDDRNVERTNKKDGKVIGVAKHTVSADGKTDIVEFTEYPEASKQPIKGKQTMVRVAAGPAGSHAVSGSWRIQSVSASENVLTVTIKTSKDGVVISQLTGQSVDANFDGKDYPIKGNPTGTVASMKKVNERTIIETDKRDGKVVEVDTMTVSDNGKTLTVKAEDKVRGTMTTFIATKH